MNALKYAQRSLLHTKYTPHCQTLSGKITVAANVYEANTVLLNSWSVIFAQCRTRLTRLP